MVEVKTTREMDKMAVTGRFVAAVLSDLSARVEPGINLIDLERRARTMIDERGATSCYWDYSPSFGRGPFRNVMCLSVNDVALHGLPHDRTLRDGDLLTMDLAVSIDGWVADSARTTIVGNSTSERDVDLIESTRRALDAGIMAALPGNRLGDISAAIGAIAQQGGYSVNRDFGGHGLGRTMHEDPHIPNVGRPHRGMRLVPGVTLALEPWWSTGSEQLVTDADGWSLRMVDGARAAHSEHTIAVTEDGARVLTIEG